MTTDAWLNVVSCVFLIAALVLTRRYPPGQFVRDLVRSELAAIRSEEAAAQREAIEGDIKASKERD